MTIIHRDRLRSVQKNEKSKGGERFARGDVIRDEFASRISSRWNEDRFYRDEKTFSPIVQKE